MYLNDFLNKKPLFYDVIDYERMPCIYARIKERLKTPKIIHIVGTNGKGTTGRFLANALYLSGFKVGHYTSPHILKFNERIWLNGSNANDALLETTHQKLLGMLRVEDATALSYFEYTTLLAMLVYQDVDYLVLEAGLGGEYDATNVFDKTLSIITPIAFDHQAFLGTTLCDIASTKIRSITSVALLAEQNEPEVIEVFNTITKEKSVLGHHIKDILGKDDNILVEVISKTLNLPDYLAKNLATAVGAMRLLGLNPDIEQFKMPQLFGRMTQFCDNVVVDVGHNVLAAKAIAENYAGQKVTLIYNSYKDKDYEEILRILIDIIDHVEIITVEDERIESQNRLKEVLEKLHIIYSDFKEVQATENYLVFGSFSVVEAFLKKYE